MRIGLLFQLVSVHRASRSCHECHLRSQHRCCQTRTVADLACACLCRLLTRALPEPVAEPKPSSSARVAGLPGKLGLSQFATRCFFRPPTCRTRTSSNYSSRRSSWPMPEPLPVLWTVVGLTRGVHGDVRGEALLRILVAGSASPICSHERAQA